MNWTERSLSRHSRKKGRNEELLHPKKYFEHKTTRKTANNTELAAYLDSFIPNYVSRTTLPQLDGSEAHVASKQAKTRPGLPLHSDETLTSLFSANVPFSSSTAQKQGKQAPQTSLAPTATVFELREKRQKLLQQQDWAGIVAGEKIAFKIEPRNYDGGIDEQPQPWNTRNSRRNRPGSQLAPQQSRAKRRPTKINIGSQSYRWSPGKNSARTNLASQRSSNHASLPSATKRVASIVRSSPHTPTSRGLHNSYHHTRVSVLSSSGNNLPLGCIETNGGIGDGCDKPQLTVLSSPQLICQPRPIASLLSFNMPHPSYHLYAEKKDELDTGRRKLPCLDSSEAFSTRQCRVSSSQANSSLAPEFWQDTDGINTAGVPPEASTVNSSLGVPYNAPGCDNYLNPNLDNTGATRNGALEQRNNDIVAIGEAEQQQGDDDAIWKTFIHENGEPILPLQNSRSVEANPVTSSNAVEVSGDEAPISRPSEKDPEPGVCNKKSGTVLAAPPRCISVEAPVNRDGVASSDQASPSERTPALPSSTAATGDKGEAVTIGLSNDCIPENKVFRFHKPKLFVGRLASNSLSAKSNTVAKKRGGKRGKRQRGNQVDIRSVPNISDDPIEEDI